MLDISNEYEKKEMFVMFNMKEDTFFCPIINDECKENCRLRIDFVEEDGVRHGACSLSITTQEVMKTLGKPEKILLRGEDANIIYLVGQKLVK